MDSKVGLHDNTEETEEHIDISFTITYVAVSSVPIDCNVVIRYDYDCARLGEKVNATQQAVIDHIATRQKHKEITIEGKNVFSNRRRGTCQQFRPEKSSSYTVPCRRRSQCICHDANQTEEDLGEVRGCRHSGRPYSGRDFQHETKDVGLSGAHDKEFRRSNGPRQSRDMEELLRALSKARYADARVGYRAVAASMGLAPEPSDC